MTDIGVYGTRLGLPVVRTTSEVIEQAINSGPYWVKAISAYFSSETFRVLTAFIEHGATVEALVGVDGAPGRDLLQAARRFADKPEVDLRIGNASGGVFHPKLLLVSSAAGDMAVLGSGNLTAGGISNNLELGLVLEGAFAAGGSAPAILKEVFDGIFSRSALIEDAFESLMAAAPDQSYVPRNWAERNRIELPDSAGAEEEDLDAVEAAGLPNAKPRTLLIELSDADVSRRPWGNAVGTHQLNLPSSLPSLLPWLPWPAPPPANNRVELDALAVGVGALRGTVETVRFNFWQRQVRDWGSLESTRFTILRDLADFVLRDIGPPAVGSVMLVGFQAGEQHLVTVLRPLDAASLGLVPTAGTSNGGLRDVSGLSWEIRDDVDWSIF